jgi:predicted GNAT family acetyltransferase
MSVINNTSESRYELVEDGHLVYADYHLYENTLSINYVYAPPALRGSGAAGRLMEGVMADVKSQNLKARPICGYAASWLKRHSEFSDLVV